MKVVTAGYKLMYSATNVNNICKIFDENILKRSLLIKM